MPYRILVYLFYYFPNANANTNVVLPLLDALKQAHDVTIYTVDFQGDQPAQEEHAGLHILRNKAKKGGFAHFVHSVYDSSPDKVTGRCKPLKRLVLRVFHKVISKRMLDRILPDETNNAYRKVLENGHYDALITVSAPILTQYETLPIARKGELWRWGVRWFPYLTDPHATFVGHKGQYDALMRREIEIFELADAVFTSRELYEDNKNTPLGRFTEKTIAVPFANLRPLTNTIAIPYLERDKINCVYVGSLFDITVRNPEYFYRLAEQCGEDFRFHIVCYAADKENERLRKKYVDGNPHITWHQRASLEECHSLICQSDILINLGNRCTNQTPSKVFDYIASGRPVVNFYTLEQDTAKYYLQWYPTKLDLLENDAPGPAEVEAFQDFCHRNAGTSIPFSQVAFLYPDYVAETVAAGFAEKLDALLTKDRKPMFVSEVRRENT